MSEVKVQENISIEEQKAQRERTLKLITVLAIVAIIMMFIGLISAVTVSRMDKFWVNLKLPSSFWISTVTIVISSITMFLALFFAKKNNQSMIKAMVGLTLLLGTVFIYFQVKGWGQLIDSGNMVTGGIYFQKGAYGEKFTLLKNDEVITFDGQQYIVQGDTLSSEETAELINFIYPICKNDRKYIPKKYDLKNYGSPYSIATLSPAKLKPTKLDLTDGTLTENGITLAPNELATLFYFSFGIKNKTPFFSMRGKYGKDFSISLNGQNLEFTNRKLFLPTKKLTEEEIAKIEAKHFEGGNAYEIKGGKVYKEGSVFQPKELYFIDNNSQENIYINNDVWYQMGKELTNGQYNEFYQANNIASSYIYIISFMHALHILIGFGLLITLLVRSTKGYYHSGHTAGLRVGGYFWHFLGLLWVVLFIFWKMITI